MTLSVTGPSVFLGQDLVGGKGIEFIPTDMDAVDGSGQPTGKRLHIARTPLINAHRGAINGHLFRQGYTHGSMAMYTDGTAYVIGRDIRTESDEIKRKLRTPVMEAHHVDATVMRIEHNIQFAPYGSLILADLYFATHPAVDMTWYEGASQAAALEDAVQKQSPGMRIRMMRDPEVTRFITWDGKYTEAQVKARAHLYRDGVTGTASVTDATAALRTTEEGFVDAFGNVLIWTDGVNARPATDANMNTVARVLRGASWGLPPQCARVGKRHAYFPSYHFDNHGVRWVAVPSVPSVSVSP